MMSFTDMPKRSLLHFATLGCLAILTSVLAEESLAENASSGSDAESYIEEVIVVGRRASLIRATEQKRDAVGVVDAISAEDLGKFPDLNLSESLQRVPGVTLNRGNGGEGQQINLRGLGPDFTRVEINGMTGTSNGTNDVFGDSGGGRGFDFKILPSELFNNAAIHKTARASDQEGGLAGTVRLSTPKPFDNPGLHVSAAVQGDFSDNANDLGDRVSVNFSNTFSDTFGVSAAVVRTDTQFESFRTGGFNIRRLSSILTADAAATATPEQLDANVTNIPHYIHDFEDRETVAASGTLQFRPTDQWDIAVTGLWSDSDTERVIARADAPSESNVTGFSDLVIQNGLITSGTFSGVQQRIGIKDNTQDEELFQFTVDAAYQPNENWTITPSAGYAERETFRVNNLLSLRRNYDPVTNSFNGADVSYRYDGDFIDWTTVGTDFGSNPEDFVLNIFIIRPIEDTDESHQFKLDFERTFDSDLGLGSVNFGLRYADREITRTGASDFLRANTDDRTQLPTLADAVRVFDVDIDGAPGSVPGQFLTADPAALLAAFYNPDGTPIAGTLIQPRPNQAAARTFDVEEEIFNLYAETTFEVENLTFNAGVRFVSTDQTSNGSSDVNGTIFPISVGNKYEELLPSLSVRWEVIPDVLIRGGYSKSLTRPNLGDIAPTEVVNGVDAGGGTGSQGNPGLQPFTADNLDIGAEWYFGNEGYVAFNFFYKDLDGVIDTGSFTENREFPTQADPTLIVNAPVVFTRPENGASAEITGFELAAQVPFDTFTDNSILKDFGVFVNYTYAESEADFNQDDDSDVRNSGLPGLSENSFNAALYFDNGRLDARLAYAWRDEYLQAFSGAFGIPRFQDDFGQLDFSANFRVIDRLSVQLQVLNITQEQVVYTSAGVPAIFSAPNAVTQIDRRVLFGLRYAF